MSVLGVLYSVNVFPRSIASIIKVKRLREIPGSKTFFVAMAWAFVIIMVPHIGSGNKFSRVSAGAFLFVLLLVYVRSVLYDVFEVQEDRIVGKETLPVCIGRDKTLRLLYVVMLSLSILLAAGPAVGMLPLSWAGLLPAVLYLLAVTILHDRDYFPHNPRLEFAVDSAFPLIICLVVLIRGL